DAGPVLADGDLVAADDERGVAGVHLPHGGQVDASGPGGAGIDGVVLDVAVGVLPQEHAQVAEVADDVAADERAGADRVAVVQRYAAVGQVLEDVVLDDEPADRVEAVVGPDVRDAAAGVDVDAAELRRAGAQHGVVAVEDEAVDGDVAGQDADQVVGV